MNRITTAAFVGLALLGGCRKEEVPTPTTGRRTESDKQVRQAWHCAMHPQIVRDGPGKCPICGMDLVPMVSGHGHDSTSDSGASRGPTIQVESSVLQKIGVRTALAKRSTVGREILADAEGVLDEASQVSVSVRSMGYLETVFPVRPGDRVHRGQILATFYSPDLSAAQGDWLSARERGDSVSARASRDRLESLGFPASAFDLASRAGHPLKAVPVASPVDGWVRTRNATRGQAVMAGAELFGLVEGSGASLEARVPLSEADELRANDRAEISGQGSRRTFAARVGSILPAADRSTRSATVRLVPDKGAGVRVGESYQARFEARSETGIVIPQDAVLHSGRRDVVFVALGGGRFRPVAVTLGPTSDGRSLVRSGLEENDSVVVSAQFLLDGESRLQSALDQLDAGSSR